MVEDVKRTKTPVFLVILACLAVMGIVVWQLFYRGRGIDENAIVHVDGTIEREVSKIALAKQRMMEVDPIPVLMDQSSDHTRVGVLFVGVSADGEANQQLLEILKEKGICYSYALSATEAIEDEDFVVHLDQNLVSLVSNGALGESNLQDQEPTKMIQSLLKSKTVLDEISKQSVSYAYCNASAVTAELLGAAAVSGYEALIDPCEEHVLDDTAFQTEEDARAYVDRLSGDCILVLNLRGRNEEVAREADVDVALPAVDLQATVREENTDEKEDVPFVTQIMWLADALDDAQIETVSLSEFDCLEGSVFLKERMHGEDASKAMLYRSVLTDQKIIGYGLYGCSNQSKENIEEMLGSKIRPSVFLTLEEIEDEGDLLFGSDLDFGILLGKEENEVSEEDLFSVLRKSMSEISERAEFNRVVLLREDCSQELIQRTRLLANTLNLKVVLPNQKIEAGGLLVSDRWDASSLEEFKTEVDSKGLLIRPLGEVVQSEQTIAALKAEEVNRLREKNGGQLSEETNLVLTTERTMGFAFYDLGNNVVIRDTLQRLTQCGAKATYFLTLDELMSRDVAIEAILESGMSLGISYIPNDTYPQTYDAVMNYLNAWQRYADWRFGCMSDAVFMPNSTAANCTEEAVHTMDCGLIKATYLPVKDDDERVSVEDVASVRERLAGIRFMRGSFVCFNLGFYEADQYAEKMPTVAGQMLSAMIEDHVDALAYRNYETGEVEEESRFVIKSVGEVLASEERYELNLLPQTVIAEDRDVLESMSTQEQSDYIIAHYYGNVNVDDYRKLPGFSSSEIARLNKDGRLTDEPVLFLTFDDWGTEQTLNALLYVLDKYDVKATFFVRTGYVDSNPNLLRTIASHGHLIAAHSDQHLALADDQSMDENLTVSISEEEAAVLREDLVTCYDKLNRIVGGYVVDGKEALAPYFRPPTLAVSRLGLYEVFDVGYEFSLSGGYSTADYEASSFEDMVNRLRVRSIGGGQVISVTNGTMIVMHMQENAKYTAQGLDYMIPIWQSMGFSFARVDEYLKS